MPLSLSRSPFGQPIARSHPHLLSSAHLTPGIPHADFHRRRRALLDALPPASAVVAVAAPVKFMSNNIFYKYRQSSDFLYLSGFQEPDSALILQNAPNRRGYTLTIFSSGSDTAREQWDGAKTPHHNIPELFHADDAQPISAFSSAVRSLLPNYSQIYLSPPPSSTSRPRRSLLKFLGSTTSPNVPDIDSIPIQKRRALSPELAKLRAIKSKYEQDVMRAAADVSARAHAKTMRFTSAGLSEGALAAHFEYLCALGGAQRPAYVPVVASGSNALTIHYTSNDHLLQQDDLVLLDAGCEYNGYASDITRTFPVSGTFSPPQRALYDAVLSAQRKLIISCSQSGVSLHSLHRESCVSLAHELKNAGLDVGHDGSARLARVYPHFVGHPIGLDLHESSGFDRHAPLQSGMVITIEPGVYVPPSPEFPKHFHGIGIRIEDEVLIGEKYATVLSVNAPKEIADVESACQGLIGLEPY